MVYFVLGTSLFGLLLTGASLGAALGLSGLIMLQFFAGGSTGLAISAVWQLMNSYALSSLPLFLLLGDILVVSKLSNRVYAGVVPLFSRIPGQLLHSNIVVCTMFGAVTGSSAATSAAVGSAAYPELAKLGYHKPAVAASLSAGGTLGLLLPPSLGFVIYGSWFNVSIGQLFLAGILPGLMMAALFMLYIFFDSWRRPQLLPASGQPPPLRKALAHLVSLWPLFVLSGCVLGPIYLGLTTVTEAAGVGVLVAILLGVTAGELTFRRLVEASISSVAGFGALAFVLIGSAILAQSVTVLAIPSQIVDLAQGMSFSKYEILLVVVVFYLIMGIFFDGISLMLTTAPFVYPVMMSAGWDPVWTGVFITIMIEIGMLTPPIGANMFVMLSIARGDVTLGELSIECLPYWLMLLFGTMLLALFPQIALFLPSLAR